MNEQCNSCPEIKSLISTIAALNEKHDKLDSITSDQDRRIQTLERKSDVTDNKLDNMMGLIKSLIDKMDKMDTKLDELQNEPDKFNVFLVELAKHFVTIGVIGGVLYVGLQKLL